jgi:hypothetical protein
MPGLLPSPWSAVIAGCLSFLLGIAYLFRAVAIVNDLKLVIFAHRRIVIMAFVTQGFMLCFIGMVILIAWIVSPGSTISRVLSFVCAGTLLLLSVWTGSTGGRSDYFLLRVSHFVTIVAAGFLLLGLAAS